MSTVEVELAVDSRRPPPTQPPMGQADLPPADLLPVRREATLFYRAVRLIGVLLLRFVFRFDVKGSQNIPRSGNYIVIANHLNWLDEFALLLLFPVEPRLHFLADPTGLVKRKGQWFLVRKTGGYVPVIREHHGDQSLYRHVDRALEVGAAVAIFPEANYGPVEAELMPFKKGFAHFAIKAGVPVIPVALSGTKDLWFRKRIKVVVGEPILPAGHTPESLTQTAFERIKALMPAYVQEPGPKLLRRQLTNLF
jgi:1-acyl-sn-glycerol-3-phosphate acyltransferase